MKLNPQQRAEGLRLYGLVQSLSYVVRLDDSRPRHLRARLAWVLRRPGDLAKPLHDELKELFAISGLWLRNGGNAREQAAINKPPAYRPAADVHSRVGS